MSTIGTQTIKVLRIVDNKPIVYKDKGRSVLAQRGRCIDRGVVISVLCAALEVSQANVDIG